MKLNKIICCVLCFLLALSFFVLNNFVFIVLFCMSVV